MTTKNETQKTTSIYIPEVDTHYVPWGNFEKVEKIVNSNKFFPVWITGESGNGKTVMVEQVCAKLKRKFVRVNFTQETDENDLIGGMRLLDGNTVFVEGPVVDAMRQGAILLLDEIDAGHVNRVMVLQSVLEGKGALIKQTGEWVKPEKGFNVFATSNTKGKGSESGKYGGTSVMNSAFLDRFAIMIEQDYPNQKLEYQILLHHVHTFFKEDALEEIDDRFYNDILNPFTQNLTNWAKHIREGNRDGQYLETISTRSLINTVRSFLILGDQRNCVKMITEKLGTDGEAFYELADKLAIFTDGQT